MSVDKSAPRVRRMFGQIAGRYDRLNHLLSLSLDRYWRWQATRRAPPDGTLPILDLCTGTGDLALSYRRRVPADVPVIGADFCHEMLVCGTHKDSDGNRVNWVEADAEALPFPDATFQLVSVAFGLRNIADTDNGLREMARVCAPGGQVVVLEFSMPTRQPFSLLYGAYFRYVLPRIGQLLARNRESAYNYLPASVGEFPQGEALAERMRLAGLTDVRWYPMTLGVATLYLAKRELS
ncbi:MAG: bifunctional demethylmenaquinone methyltransferase/2-methoxy-6-polyprenyl-1,4-benzoquinol methylase UbiE [Pirellulales bacterium]|nr:bifunctional demethylmenaquinone methyltransferase/2-methoxy-6-polyprenyl-1,4-benzoquinol methylase UbiE [Pirellulales bacterium]